MWMLALLGGCNVFDRLDRCESDAACPWGYTCGDGVCAADEGDIVFGVSLPLTGPLGTLGQQLATVFPLVEFQVAGAGGVTGRPVRFDVVDDETSPTRAVQVFEQFVAAHVTGVVGPLTSPQAVEVLDLSSDASLVTITSGAGANVLSTGQPLLDRWFFRTMSSVERGSATALVSFAREGPPGGAPCDTLVTVHSDDAIGEAYRDAMAIRFPEVGGVVLDPIAVPPGEQLDYVDAVDALIAAKPDCAVLAVVPTVGAALLEEFESRRDALPPRWDTFFWLGSSSLGTPDFIEESARRGGVGEGLYGADADTRPPTAEFGDFERAYRTFHGLPDDATTPIYASNTYDAAVLLVLAAAAGGTVDPVSFRDHLWEVTATGEDHVVYGPSAIGDALSAIERGDAIHFSGASSQLRFDGYGTVSLPSLVWQVRGDEIVVVTRYSEEGVLLE